MRCSAKARNGEQLNHAEIGLSILLADHALYRVKVEIKYPETYNNE